LPASEDLPALAATFAVLLLSISLHESAHAFVADRLGDDTPRRLGRVTWNPLPHLHPLGSILLPALLIFSGSGYLFGAGRPVPVTMDRLRHPTRDFMLVALAGPFSNLLIALVATLLFVAVKRTGLLVDHRLAYHAFGTAIQLNVFLAVLNSLPIPGLDGSRLVGYLLPRSLQSIFYRLDAIGIIILIVLFFFTDVIEAVFAATAVPLLDWWSDVYIGWMI